MNDEQTAGPVWRDRGTIIANQQARIAELELACQRLRDDYQGALAERDEARAEVERKEMLLNTMDHFAEVAETCERKANESHARRKAAEADAAGLRARIDALADEFDLPRESGGGDFGPHYAEKVRAALAAEPPPAAATDEVIAALKAEPMPMTLSHDRLILRQFERDGGQVVAVRCPHTIGLCFEAEHDGVGTMLGKLPCPCNDPSEVVAYVEPELKGCDCTELCSMGPTCPGGSLAGLDGSGCWRTKDEPTPAAEPHAEDGAPMFADGKRHALLKVALCGAEAVLPDRPGAEDCDACTAALDQYPAPVADPDDTKDGQR